MIYISITNPVYVFFNVTDILQYVYLPYASLFYFSLDTHQLQSSYLFTIILTPALLTVLTLFTHTWITSEYGLRPTFAYNIPALMHYFYYKCIHFICVYFSCIIFKYLMSQILILLLLAGYLYYILNEHDLVIWQKRFLCNCCAKNMTPENCMNELHNPTVENVILDF